MAVYFSQGLVGRKVDIDKLVVQGAMESFNLTVLFWAVRGVSSVFYVLLFEALSYLMTNKLSTIVSPYFLDIKGGSGLQVSQEV